MPKSSIKEVIKSAKKLKTYQDKIDFLHNKFKGEVCYILGCGPSILDVDLGKLNSELDNSLCLSLKLIYFEFEELVDFHFFNCNNFKNYPYNENTFMVSQSDFCEEKEARVNVWGSQPYDLSLKVSPQEREERLSKTKQIEKWSLYNSGIERPWGPGIMYESAIFFAYHLGCSEIKTIGWDYIDPNGTDNTFVHFYEEKFRANLRNPSDTPYDEEMKESIELAHDFKVFFEQKGIKLTAHDSPKCFLPDSIERYVL